MINWGYWGSVGIVTDERYRARMARMGIGSIEPGEGMAALEHLLSGPLPQVALVKTLTAEALSDLNSTETLTVYPSPSSRVNHLSASLMEQMPPEQEAFATAAAPLREFTDLLRALLFSQLRALNVIGDPSGSGDAYCGTGFALSALVVGQPLIFGASG